MRAIWICALLAVIGFVGTIHAAEAVLPQVFTAELDAEWKIAPKESTAKTTGERTVLSPPPGQVLTLERRTAVAAPSECVLEIKMHPAKGAGCNANISFVCAERPDKTQQTLVFSLAHVQGYPHFSYSTSVVGSKIPATSGTLYVTPVTKRSLAWTDDFRRLIDAQMAAAPKVEEMVVSLRCKLENDRFRVWINGRFVNETKLDAGMDRTSIVKIAAGPNADIVSAHVAPAKPTAPEFEPISIDGHVNSGLLAGEKVDRASLPRAAANSESPTLHGVPFSFAKNSAGNDHIDVGQSWARFGELPGYIASNFGALGGRWISADRIDPSRICLYVPQGRYKALHLVAVADGRDDSVPVVTAQFYRPDAGHPLNFSAEVPAMRGESKGEGEPVNIRLENGKSAKLYHVKIPLDPDAFSWLSDLPRIGLEITKKVQFFRGYPDPLEYSWHAAGLPSSVQIYAMTLERVDVDVDVVPDSFGHVWTAPETPSYTIKLRNNTSSNRSVKLVASTRSHDGKEISKQDIRVDVRAGETGEGKFKFTPKRYGLHELTLTYSTGDEQGTFRRNFAFLHENTREQEVWELGRGAIFGYWPWCGAHVTPTAEQEIAVMAAVGAETSTANYSASKPEVQALAQKHRFIAESAFTGGVMYLNGFYAGYPGAPKFDPAKPEEAAAALVKALKAIECKPGPISRPTYVPFFAEPQIGNLTTGIWPSHYGEEYKLSDYEQKVFEDMLAKYLTGARAIRKEWPNLKLLLPYGDPMNASVFLRLSPESRDLIDGCALDLPGFERLPEQQVNQVVLNRMYPIFKDIKQYKKDPYFVLIEGTHISSKDIDTGEQGQANIATRNFLVLMGYGITRFESCNAPFDCANYWGENHYGGGWCTRLPVAMPKIGYVNYATLTRHLNRANFTKYITTGSTSVFCQQFQHYKTRKLVHVLWTIRGKREVQVKVASGASLELFDGQDNVTVLKEKGGFVTLTIDQSPQYLEGLSADAEITLGASDHSDSAPIKSKRGFFEKLVGSEDGGPSSTKLANLGDGTWKIVEKEDLDYAKNKPLQVERFLAKMTATSVAVPKDQGGKAMAVHLEKQPKERGVMPYYTTIEPAASVVIPGKASHLGLWVHAASDWGRVVYVVRDAKDEKWLSVGTKEEWNNDDIHGWSAFCFDGWRYVKFELPSSAPYDNFREYGTSWWGHYGGDGVVDLPLKLEKVIIERRNKVVYCADLVDAKPDDVLLGDLYAEYADAASRGEEAVRLSRLRMSVPKDVPPLSNPIAEFAATGVGAPTKVLGVKDPEREYDGTRCHVNFEPVAGAKSYDIWVSPYADGRGALQLGTGWTESGKLITELRPGIEFFAFVVYTDKDGAISKPSAPLAFKLVDRFGYK